MTSKTRRFTAAVLVILVATTLTTGAKGDYLIKVINENVSVHISGDLVQGVPNSAANNTAEPFKSFPTFKIHLLDQNASVLSTALKLSLQHLNPTASATKIILDSWSNGTSIHYDLVFNIEGISRGHGAAESIDLSWRSFVIPDNFKVGNLTFNGALPDYLGDRISLLAREPASTGPPLVQRKLWYWNGNVIFQDEVSPTIANLMILNFTGLSKPLQMWSASADLTRQLYRYQASTGFNLTRIVQVIEPDTTTNFARDVIYRVNAIIQAPWGSFASGDSVILEAKGGLGTFVMIVSILSTISILAGAILYEKRLHATHCKTKSRGVKR